MEERVIPYINPDTTIYILRNVPLDNSYKDTLTFASTSAQLTYFMSKQKYKLTECTPVRMQNKIKVGLTADHLYDCNYICWNNANYEGKWFYAFITAIDFSNAHMAEISFEIDVMQTWWPNYTVKPCYVEREHTNNDAIGANTIPEGLEKGEYVFLDLGNSGQMDSYVYNVFSTSAEDGTDVTGKVIGGIYTGADIFSFPSTNSGINNLNNFIISLTEQNKSDAIVSIAMSPASFADPSYTVPPVYIIRKEKQYGSISGYVPKNNKLFVHPYNFLYVENGEGNSADFRYEDFSTNICGFEMTGDITPNPNIILYPLSYKGVTKNINEKMGLNGFPQCCYNIDAYKAWLAQNGSNIAVQGISSAFTMVGSAALGNMPGVIMGAQGVFNSLREITVQQSRPPQANGAQGSSVQAASRLKDFRFYGAQIKAEYAKVIDDFFSMYGYATHRLKVPNITGRESWNYVKTIDSVIVGSVPFNDMAKIRSIFDSGITFWHGDYVGDYSRRNSIVGGEPL